MPEIQVVTEGHKIASQVIDGVSFTFVPISVRKKFEFTQDIFPKLQAELDGNNYVFKLIENINDLVVIHDLDAKTTDALIPIKDLHSLGELSTSEASTGIILAQLITEIVLAFCEYVRSSVLGDTSAKK